MKRSTEYLQLAKVNFDSKEKLVLPTINTSRKFTNSLLQEQELLAMNYYTKNSNSVEREEPAEGSQSHRIKSKQRAYINMASLNKRQARALQS